MMAGALLRPMRAVLGGLVASVLVAGLVAFGRFETLEGWSLRLLFEIRGQRAPTAPIVIVTIDESSINEIGHWPFPRRLHAQLLERVSAGNPVAIGVDIIFDSSSPRGGDDDLVLGEAIRAAGNVVLGSALTEDRQGFYVRETLSLPIPLLREGAAAVAPINLITDPDGYVRRAPLTVRLGDDAVAAFDPVLHALAKKAGVPAAPLPAGTDVLINFRGGPRTFPWVPFYRIVNGEIPPEIFQDTIVLIGPTSVVLHDVFPTAFARGGTMPGVEIHANVLDTYLTGDGIREAPVWLSTAGAVGAGLLGSWLVVRFLALRALLTIVGLWALLTVLAYVGFTYFNVWVRGMSGATALLLGYAITTIEHYVREQREKRRLSQFFSPNVLTHVVREKDAMKSNRRLATVLFSDLRGFTTMSEKLEPEQVAEILHEYLTEMTEIVFRHGGTVDKYIGDCIMALYNAPFDDVEHAAHAIQTGLDFQERTLQVSKRWEERLGVTIRNGVGINTGECVVGTMGSRQRLEYTAIGDSVNLAARLESLTKDYGASIIISESTYSAVAGRFLIRELGAVTVKGKTQPVKIYAVLPQDLRQHPRAIVEATAVLRALDADEECVVRVVDVSAGGLNLAGLPDGWDKGKTLQLRCEGPRLGKPIVAEATIVWRREGVAGVAFGALAPDAPRALGESVASQTGTPT